ncbi:prepilin-type N-terminal cleavage/methylation domain-containing protein [Thiohalobacter sp.]|uniref:prepilin-type N-terminal cleavage/methylation domain-containing protein n=1 Tax=Thiohalobacter sp. TaxID=2025948 RepID=UPI00262AD191|nr:prepilin-type N-terminal cleavage/methylation domain-containing protein [Thiohalobacter sp.]
MLRTAGFTLTELMIGLTLGLLVIGGGYRFYQLNLNASQVALAAARLDGEARAALTLMAGDLRRAGFRAFDPTVQPAAASPFGPVGDLRLGQAPGEAADSCVLFSYDRNADGLLGVGRSGQGGPGRNRVNVEQFGFRLQGGALEVRLAGATHDCASGQWQDLTSTATRVTALRFRVADQCLDPARPGQPCRSGQPALLRKQLTIDLTAASRVPGGPTVRLSRRVRPRNDGFLAHAP